MRKCCVMLAALWCMAPALAYGDDVQDPCWQAGAAKVVITPSRPMWMSGYGARNKPAEGKISDLWAKALVLESPDGRRVVLVTMDLVGIARDLSANVCAELKKKHGLPREAILLSVSHTHTGPVIRGNLDMMYDLGEKQTKLIADYRDKLMVDHTAPEQDQWPSDVHHARDLRAVAGLAS